MVRACRGRAYLRRIVAAAHRGDLRLWQRRRQGSRYRPVRSALRRAPLRIWADRAVRAEQPLQRNLPRRARRGERKSVVYGKSVSGRVGLGGRRDIKKKKKKNKQEK